VILAVLAGVLLPDAAHAASGCTGGDRMPAELGRAATRVTTLCLLNAERSARGLQPLRQDARLRGAARRHSRDMVAHRYFGHDSRSGAPFSKRIAVTGWMHSRGDWILGENLAWGSGASATPGAIVAAWMASPGHRENILKRDFRVIGIGLANGVPVATGGRGATYTTDMGS
jgi:uncharacterized protein YkwD